MNSDSAILHEREIDTIANKVLPENENMTAPLVIPRQNKQECNTIDRAGVESPHTYIYMLPGAPTTSNGNETLSDKQLADLKLDSPSANKNISNDSISSNATVNKNDATRKHSHKGPGTDNQDENVYEVISICSMITASEDSNDMITTGDAPAHELPCVSVKTPESKAIQCKHKKLILAALVLILAVLGITCLTLFLNYKRFNDPDDIHTPGDNVTMVTEMTNHTSCFDKQQNQSKMCINSSTEMLTTMVIGNFTAESSLTSNHALWDKLLKTYSYSNIRNLIYYPAWTIKLNHKSRKPHLRRLQVVGDELWYIDPLDKISIYNSQCKLIRNITTIIPINAVVKTESDTLIATTFEGLRIIDYNGRFLQVIDQRRSYCLSLEHHVLYALSKKRVWQRENVGVVLTYVYKGGNWSFEAQITLTGTHKLLMDPWNRLHVRNSNLYLSFSDCIRTYDIIGNLIDSYWISSGSYLCGVDRNGMGLVLTDTENEMLKLCAAGGKCEKVSLINHTSRACAVVVDPGDNGIWAVGKYALCKYMPRKPGS